MNRNEWLTLAFTLAGAGGTYFITQKPIWAAAALGLGLMIMLGLFLFDKPKEASPKQPANEVRDSFKQSLENVGNAKSETNIYLGGQPVESVPPLLVELIKPNLVFLGIKNIETEIDSNPESHLLNICERKGGDFTALCAQFSNEALVERRIAPLYGVTSQIVYNEAQEGEQRISRAIWLEDGRDTITLTIQGEPHYLAMLIIEKGSGLITVPWRRLTPGSWMGPGLAEDVTKFDACPETLRLRLINKQGELIYETNLNISVDGSKFIFSKRLQP